ncbi:FecR family protein, partial [Litoricolaceae bacterium]|nr:FecR family protein [Litorivicinaceae bacterium]
MRFIWLLMVVGLVNSQAVGAAYQSGVIAAFRGEVSVERGSEIIPVKAAGPIFLNDTVVTGAGARLQILLRDQSTFSVGGGARITIDEFVYQPKEKTGRLAASVSRGAFRFVSGKIAKTRPDNMKVKVGDVVVAVRGTEVIGSVQPDQSSIILLSGAIDVMSLSPECVSNSGGSSVFEIGPDGDLVMSAPPVVDAPIFCSQSVNSSGFGVSVSSAGEVSQPLRIDFD